MATMAMARRLGLLYAMVLLALGCAHSGGDPDTGKRGLIVTCSLPSAHLYIDDYPIARTEWQDGKKMSLAKGPHRVETRAEGYYSEYREVQVPEQGFVTVTLTPRARPPQSLLIP